MADLQQLARDHLWMHFTRMGGFGGGPGRADHRPGRRLLPLGLERQALPRRARRAVLGQHRLRLRRGDRPGGARADARAAVLHQLVVRASAGDRARGRAGRRSRPATSTASSSSPAARRRSSRRGSSRGSTTPRAARSRSAGARASRRPGTTRSSRRRRGPHRYKAIARHIAYHGTTMGALSINGIPALRTAVRAARARGAARPQHEPLPPPGRRRPRRTSPRFLLDDLEQAILAMGPETVCLVHMEPVQNAGGCFTPPVGYWQGVRAICDRVRHPALGRRGDHRLRPPRRLVRLRALRHPPGHRHLRQGALVLVRRRSAPCSRATRVMEPFLDATSMYSHGDHLRRPSRDVRDRAQEHRDHEARAASSSTCARTRTRSGRTLETLLELPIVGDVRGTGFFYAIELVKDKETTATFDDDECESLLRGFLSPALFEAGLICRAGRPRRPGDPDLAAARRGRGGARRDRRHPRRRARPMRPAGCRRPRSPPPEGYG